jgi:hypothetical protein
MRNRFIALLIRFNGSELALGGLVIIVRATGPNVRGFIHGEEDGFSEEK